MNPDPNSVSIRLEIQVPSGPGRAGVRMAGFGQKEGHDLERFTSTEPPNPNGDPWPVLPDGAGLGLICARVEYGTPMTAVKAWVYPSAHYPSLPTFPWTHPVATGAVPGVSTNGGFTWVWRYPTPGMVPGAAHLPAATGGAPNYLGIWYKLPGFGYLFDDSPFFYGVTDPVPCGSGSGSGSAIMMEGMEELMAAQMLLIAVPDGPFEGRHSAKRHPSGRWVAETRKGPLEIAAESGGGLVIRVGHSTVRSKKVEANPFTAVFSGERFGARHDVVVTAR